MADGRKNNGGKRPGAGRKPKEIQQDVIRLLDDAWPQEQREAAIKKMAELASGGDVRALTLLLAYRFGKPLEKHEVMGGAGEALLQPVADAIEKVYGKG